MVRVLPHIEREICLTASSQSVPILKSQPSIPHLPRGIPTSATMLTKGYFYFAHDVLSTLLSAQLSLKYVVRGSGITAQLSTMGCT